MAASATALFRCRSNAYQATARKNFVGAANWCVKAVTEHGFQAADCANLAFLLFDHCSTSTVLACYDRLNAHGFGELRSPSAVFLRLSFEIELGSEQLHQKVQTEYLDGILRKKIKREPEQPVLFWHIPKCSGTSLNATLSNHFYGTKLAEVWPGYNYRPLIAYLLEHCLQNIPYASSVHLGADLVHPGVEHFSFTVLRDPVKRNLSMYRQEMSVNAALVENEKNWHHYRALARYGYFWDYRRDHSFDAWLENVPPGLLQRQLTTFSAGQSVDRAVERVSDLGYYFFRDIARGSESELFGMLGLDHGPDTVPDDLNRSDKSVPVPDYAERLLRPRLSKEIAMVERLSR